MPTPVVTPYMKKPTICSQSEAWKMAYEIIKLENDLINHRVTALLLTNAFLITALGNISKTPFTPYSTCAGIIAITAFIITFTLGRGIAAASRQILKSAQWYYEYCHKNLVGPAGSFSPPIVGYPTAWPFWKIRFGKTVAYENERVIAEDSLGSLGTGLYWLVNSLLFFWAAITVYSVLTILRTPSLSWQC